MNNPQAVKFCNEGVRTTADHLAEAYYAARTLVAIYDATGISLIQGVLSISPRYHD